MKPTTKGSGPDATNDRPAKKYQNNTADSMAPCARPASPAAGLRIKPGPGIDRPQQKASRRCDRIRSAPEMGPMLENIVNEHGAFTHALSWVFSRQEFFDTGFPVSHGFRRDGLVRKAGRMACSMFSTSRHPLLLKRQRVVFQSRHGAETMTITTPKMGFLGTTPATFPSSIARRIAIEAALTLALFHVQNGNTHAAVGRSIRATSMLKQACAESTSAGRV